MKLKGQGGKPDSCCSTPSLNHVSPKRPLAAVPGKFDYPEKPFANSPYDNTSAPSPSDSMCSSVSEKESVVSTSSYKEPEVIPVYNGGTQPTIYTSLER